MVDNVILSNSVYNLVGRTMGYVVAPVSLLGIGLPVALLLPRQAEITIGSIFLALAGAGLAGNSYLIMRRRALGFGASPFPIFASFAGVPAVVVLTGGVWWQAGLGAVGVIICDFLVPFVLATALARCLGIGRTPPRARPN